VQLASIVVSSARAGLGCITVSTLLTHQRVCTWLGWRLSLFSSVRRSSASRLAGTSRARLHHSVYPVDSSARVHLVGVAFVSLLQRAAQLGEQAGRHEQGSVASLCLPC
jgi:hypothetical protein